MRCHLLPVRMAIVKKKFMNNICWRVCGRKGTLVHCWWECKLIEPLWRTVWIFLKKLGITLPYDPYGHICCCKLFIQPLVKVPNRVAISQAYRIG